MRLRKLHAPVAASLAMWAACGAIARADLIDCGAISGDPDRYKVVQDDFVIAAATADSDLSVLMDRLNYRAQNQIDQLMQEMGSTNSVRVVFCNGRRPSDPSDFTHSRASTLNAQHVVLEFWGVVDETQPAAGPVEREARVRYVIMPLQDYNFGQADVPALQSASYPRTGTSAPANSTQLLDNLPELTIYALIGIATKARHAIEYRQAITAYRKAQSLIADLLAQGNNASLESLAAFVHREVCDTMVAAKNNPAHAGFLADAPLEDCHD